MAEDNGTLTTFYDAWKEYQERMKESLAPLTAEQLTLRAALGLRSIGENALHIVGCRCFWFAGFLGEEGGEEMKVYAHWNEAAVSGSPVTPAPSAAELIRGLDYTWQRMADCLARWTPQDMRQTFPDDWGDGTIVHLSRAWVVWHVLEHDLHHGGELSFTFGVHGIPANFPG